MKQEDWGAKSAFGYKMKPMVLKVEKKESPVEE